MASNNQTFDSQDELITQADQSLQWDKLTIEAIQLISNPSSSDSYLVTQPTRLTTHWNSNRNQKD